MAYHRLRGDSLAWQAGRPAGFSLAFLSALTVLALAAELQLEPIASVMDWLYSVSAKLGHKAPVKLGMDWDYVLQGSGGGKAVAVEGFRPSLQPKC